jgi:hypothetical protein
MSIFFRKLVYLGKYCFSREQTVESEVHVSREVERSYLTEGQE